MTFASKPMTFAAALALGSMTSFAALANTDPDCATSIGTNGLCLGGEEVDVDNQAADGPGAGAPMQVAPTTDDMGTGQADGGSIDPTPNDVEETTNETDASGNSLDTL